MILVPYYILKVLYSSSCKFYASPDAQIAVYFEDLKFLRRMMAEMHFQDFSGDDELRLRFFSGDDNLRLRFSISAGTMS